MNKRPEDTPETTPETTPKSGVDQGRRRLGTLGVSGTAVALSVSSRSAVAGWGTCTGSELASGNLSRAGTANPCGCSPGFWWNNNGTALWASSPTLNMNYPANRKFNTVFGRNFYTSANVRLSQIGPGTGLPNTFSEKSLDNVGMHAVAALLNAQFYGNRYPAPYKTAAAVISAFKTAFDGGQLSLKAFVAEVDVYRTGVWCTGTNH